ncbi:MAG: hypothetical protein DRI34_03095 [Deltaproteobacteria bacterium]|nr:MAG: hypothetical protein DRI34_03095 [Deltaproteobacteria bacterium]
MKAPVGTAILLLLATAGLVGPACGRAEQPPYAQVVVLEGDAYQRGLQHGRALSSRIRSLYTMLLETNLMPYLNREQDDVMNFLTVYQQPEYQEGRFSYRMLLESGQHLLEQLEQTHPEFVEEMHGVADGSGVPFEQILVMNTFVDTMLAFRSVTFFIRQLQSPRLEELEFLAPLAADGIDNNGDGQVDEADDALAKSNRGGTWRPGYEPRNHAVMVEVPGDARIRMLFYDPPGLGGFSGGEEPKPGDLQGMDPESVRIQLDDTLYTAADDCIESTLQGEKGEYLEVIFTPPGGLPPASVVSLIVQAHNISIIDNPPPLHPRVMRDEHIVFTTRGYGQPAAAVANLGAWDGRSMPPALGLAVRGSSTPDGQPRLAHHFALLDSNIAHKHAVLFHHHPDQGNEFAVLGWAGIIWGFSGMNADGLACLANPSDTLDNPLAGQVKHDAINAKLLSEGTPIGLQLRLALQQAGSVAQATELLRGEGATFGWNLLLVDAAGGIRGIERDANILGDPDGGFVELQPGQAGAAAGPDDLHTGMHFAANVPDFDTRILIFDAQPQNWWSSFYYRSLRAGLILGEQTARRYGQLDTAGLVELLRTPELVDTRESMNAVVFEPARATLHYAMGQVPATAGQFVPYSLEGTP